MSQTMFTAQRLRRRVTVHVTFIKLGEINTLKECFDADIVVKSVWREPLLDKSRRPRTLNLEQFWNPKLFIENAIGEPQITSSLHIEYAGTDAYVLERKRFKGTFMEQMELWEFPFDMQDLTAVVMTDIPIEEIKLVEDPNEIHKIFKRSFIDEQEFYLYKYVNSEQLELQKDKADPFLKRGVLKVHALAARRPWNFVWNHFAVTFLIACLAFLTFSVPNTKAENRLQLSFTLFLTSVAFKFVIAQSLPRIPYLTYMDRYVLATLVTLALTCFYHGLQTLLPVEDYPYKDYIAIAIIGGLYITYNIWFLVRLIVAPFKRRREMSQAEQAYTEKVEKQALHRHTSNKSQPKLIEPPTADTRLIM